MYYVFTGEELGWTYRNAFWKASASVDADIYSNLGVLLERAFEYCVTVY